MRKLKNTFCFILCLVLSMFILPQDVWTAEKAIPSWLGEYSESMKLGETNISIKKPVIFGMTSTALQSELNTKIEQIYSEEMANIDDETEVDFTYDWKPDAEIVSLLIYITKTSASTDNKVISINFSNKTNRIVKITDCMGPNGIKLANGYISSLIKANPDEYNSSFSGISEEQDFYVENGDVYLLFDSFEIAPGYKGIVPLKMKLSNIITVDIVKQEYLVETDYDVRMIQLRQIADAFGYKLIWRPATAEIDIERVGQFVTSIKLGANSYFKGKSAKRPLECAPEVKDGRTYVPISFFEEMLGLSYSVDTTGTITFSEYTSE